MAQITRTITDFQFSTLLELQKEQDDLNNLIAQYRKKQQLALDLILDSFGYRGFEVQLNPQARELIITVPDAPKPPVLPTPPETD